MKKIIITGASKGIGKEIAINLLKQNFKVIGISRSHTINHQNYFSQVGDLNNVRDLKVIINNIISKHKKIDALISNAGYGIFENVENLRINDIINFSPVCFFMYFG